MKKVKNIVAKRVAPKKAVSKKAAPKKAVSRKAAPKKAVSRKAAPKKAVSRKAAPKKAVSRKAAPKKAVSRKAAPKKAVSRKAAPKKAVSKKATRLFRRPRRRRLFQRRPHRKVSKKAAPKKAVSRKAAPKKATLKKTIAPETTNVKKLPLGSAEKVASWTKKREMSKEAQQRFKELLERATKQGYLTTAEIHDHLPDEISSDEEAERTVHGVLKDIGIAVYDAPPAEEEILIRRSEVTSDDIEEQTEAALSTVAGFGRTTDPVRIYMREMSAARLLKHGEEIEIARKIESGLRSIMQVIAKCPSIIEQIIELEEKIKNEEVKVGDIIDGFFPG